MTSKATVIYSGQPEGRLPEAHLWARSGNNAGRRYLINKAEALIGRSGSCDVEVEDDRASLHHARIVVIEGRHFICDLGSTNGTFVNDQRIEETALRDGDMVQVGETVFEYLSFSERSKSITLRGGSEDNLVPTTLRDSARSLLNRERQGSSVQIDLIPSGRETAGAPLVRTQTEVVDVRALEPYVPAQGGVAVATPLGEQEPSLQDLIEKLKKILFFFLPYWRSILGIALAGAVLGAASLKLLPPGARASFQITLQERVTENPVGRFERANVSFFRSAEQNFKSPALLEKTLETLGDTDITAEVIQRHVDKLIFIKLGPNTYGGQFAAGNADRALRFLETHLQLYLDTEVEKTLRVIQAEADFLNQQVADAQTELNKAEWELLVFKEKNVSALPEQARQNYAYLFDLQKRKSDVSQEIARIGALLHSSRSKAFGEAPLTVSRVTKQAPYRQAITDKNRELSEARAQGKGDEHPDVMRLRDELNQLEKLARDYQEREGEDVERTRNQVYDSAKSEIFSLEGQYNAASKDLERIDRDYQNALQLVERLPKLEAMYSELTRKYEAAKKTHATLSDQVKMTNLQLQLERAAAQARYDLIQPPALEYSSPAKQAILRTFAGGFVFFFFGIAQAFVRALRVR